MAPNPVPHESANEPTGSIRSTPAPTDILSCAEALIATSDTSASNVAQTSMFFTFRLLGWCVGSGLVVSPRPLCKSVDPGVSSCMHHITSSLTSLRIISPWNVLLALVAVNHAATGDTCGSSRRIHLGQPRPAAKEPNVSVLGRELFLRVPPKAVIGLIHEQSEHRFRWNTFTRFLVRILPRLVPARPEHCRKLDVHDAPDLHCLPILALSGDVGGRKARPFAGRSAACSFGLKTWRSPLC